VEIVIKKYFVFRAAQKFEEVTGEEEAKHKNFKMKVIATALVAFALLDLVLLSSADTLPEAIQVEATQNVAGSNGTIEIAQDSNGTENASVEVDSSPEVNKIDPEKTEKNETVEQNILNKTISTDDLKQTNLNVTELEPAEVPAVNETAPVGNSANDSEEYYDEPEKSDAENIQERVDHQQDELEEEFGRNGSEKATIKLFEDPITSEPVLHSGHFALIFASTLIILSVLAYVGLVLWRGRLEQRYGSGRQQLVTEDDFYNNNDVRYFGL